MHLLTGKVGFSSASTVPLPDIKKKPVSKLSMWLLTMPGLTGEILERTGKEIPGVLWHSQLVNLGPPEWAAWQDACRKALNLPIDWEEQQYLEVYNEFKRMGWGKTFGPGSPGGYRKKKPKEEIAPINEIVDLKGTLFE